MFSGGDYADGCSTIVDVLNEHNVKAHFFFTGDFYRTKKECVQKLINDNHYLGAHSDKHLLYASWENRDELLITKEEFVEDLNNNYKEMEKFGIEKNDALYFMPPYEWYNQTIADWTNELGLQLISFTPGTRSNADYTIPSMGDRYVSSEEVYNSIINFEEENMYGLNGFHLFLHAGTHPERTDKFYNKLDKLLSELKTRDYQFKLLNEK
jgi:peptidoglycan/xylan/chitin deacetylase (PgdA/CDA1 family)